jgi:hypothetical protein
VVAAVSKPFTDGNWNAPDSGVLLRTDPWPGPAGADGAVGAGHVAASGLHLLPSGVGLLVSYLEVTAQLGDELLAGHRTGAAPKVTGSKHMANHGPMLGLGRLELKGLGGGDFRD